MNPETGATYILIRRCTFLRMPLGIYAIENFQSIRVSPRFSLVSAAPRRLSWRLIIMKRAAILISIVLTAQFVHAASQERSVSPSRQFVIYGADAELRGAVSDLAERTKADFLALLRQRAL